MSSRIACASSVAVDCDPDRLSFAHAVEVLRDAIAEAQMVAREQIEALLARWLRDIARKRLPERRARFNPRVVKQKMSKFKLKRAEHYQPAEPSRSYREAVVVQAVAPDNSTLVLDLQPCPKGQKGAILDLRQPEYCRI